MLYDSRSVEDFPSDFVGRLREHIDYVAVLSACVFRKLFGMFFCCPHEYSENLLACFLAVFTCFSVFFPSRSAEDFPSDFVGRLRCT